MSTESVPSTDEEQLARLGYQQELHRRLSGFSNFAVSFSIISILAGAITSYGIAMNAGGPLAIVLGWLFVGIMVTFVALAMAEVCSAYPTAGALYWWAAALAKRNKPAWAWFVGWFNFLGEPWRTWRTRPTTPPEPHLGALCRQSSSRSSRVLCCCS